MKDPVAFLLNLLGYEYRKPSLLRMTMLQTTHGSWLQRISSNGHIEKYRYSLYTEM